MSSELFVVAIVLVAAFMAAVAQYMFKKSVPKFDVSIGGLLSLLRNRLIIMGLAVYIASFAFYLYALRSSELSFVYPTFASVFVFVLIMSRFKLKEHITLHRALGVGIVILGILIVAFTY